MAILVKTFPYATEPMKTHAFFAEVSSQRSSPALIEGAYDQVRERLNGLPPCARIACSPQLRARQSAALLKKHLLPDAKIRIDPDLNEVPFSLDEINPLTYSSTIARAKFVRDFKANSLLETRASIQRRIQRVRQTYDGTSTICVTHTFLMKLISLEKQVFSRPETLSFNPSLRLFEHGQTLPI